jgi:hypothetical protein
MGKVTKKILGATRGKVGDVVFRKFRMANVDSAYQPNPFNPNTEAQRLQRGKFAIMSNLAQEMAPAINKGFAFAVKGTMLSPRNRFIRENKTCFTGSDPNLITVNYNALKVALGARSHCNYSVPSFDNPLEVEVSFTSTDATADANNQVVLVVYCPDDKSCVVSPAAKLSDGSVSATVPSEWNGLKVHVWGVEYSAEDHPEDYIVKGQPYASIYVGQGNIG